MSIFDCTPFKLNHRHSLRKVGNMIYIDYRGKEWIRLVYEKEYYKHNWKQEDKVNFLWWSWWTTSHYPTSLYTAGGQRRYDSVKDAIWELGIGRIM